MLVYRNRNGGKFDGAVYRFGPSNYWSIPWEIDSFEEPPRHRNYALGSGNYWNGRLLPDYQAILESDFEALVWRWLRLTPLEGRKLQKRYLRHWGIGKMGER